MTSDFYIRFKYLFPSMFYRFSYLLAHPPHNAATWRLGLDMWLVLWLLHLCLFAVSSVFFPQSINSTSLHTPPITFAKPPAPPPLQLRFPPVGSFVLLAGHVGCVFGHHYIIFFLFVLSRLWLAVLCSAQCRLVLMSCFTRPCRPPSLPRRNIRSFVCSLLW